MSLTSLMPKNAKHSTTAGRKAKYPKGLTRINGDRNTYSERKISIICA